MVLQEHERHIKEISNDLSRHIVDYEANGFPPNLALNMLNSLAQMEKLHIEVCANHIKLNRHTIEHRFSEIVKGYIAKSCCISSLYVAEMLTHGGDTVTAKNIYRYIITDYGGAEFRSYVKRAEFALEDMRDKR